MSDKKFTEESNGFSYTKVQKTEIDDDEFYNLKGDYRLEVLTQLKRIADALEELVENK